MATVKGKWTFNDVLPESSVYAEVNFTSGGSNYVCIQDSYAADPVHSLAYVYDDGEDWTEVGVYAFEESTEYEIEKGWWSDGYKTIDFGETEQTVSDDFYAWLIENAVKVVENIKIDITENGTTTLVTAGKYCDRNIDVNVEVSGGDDAFWDGFQNYGNRTFYEYAFVQSGFEQLHPKYKVVPTNSRSMCMFQDVRGTKVIEKAYFDLSNCTVSQSSSGNGHYGTFRKTLNIQPTLEVIEDIGLQAAYYYQTFASQTLLHTIEVLRVVEETMFNKAFSSCYNLQNITIEGTIGQNGFDVSDCEKLSKVSIESIINALSSTTSGLTVTISKTAKEAVFTDAEWATLIATKSNWTISLA